MKFDFAIGNPPYQDESIGDNKTYQPPIYDKFMDAAYEIAEKVELIHPAKFLFNAGGTSPKWNEKMLNNEHFKILDYEPDSKNVFSSADITGGIAISYYDKTQNFGSIGVFTNYDKLSSILNKVKQHQGFLSIKQTVYSRTVYRLTEKMHQDHPEAVSQLSKGHRYDMSSNIFERIPQIFADRKPTDGFEYIRMLGIIDDRTYRWLRKDYVKDVENLYKYKIVMARADGAAGTVGKPIPARVIGTPTIEIPGTGTTESFISIGSFETENEANSALKYIKTRFARALLSVLKKTQDITPEKWKYVPLQDFTSNSDIDWSQSISNIDQQLYTKYGLDDKEEDFIKTYVKEME